MTRIRPQRKLRVPENELREAFLCIYKCAPNLTDADIQAAWGTVHATNKHRNDKIVHAVHEMKRYHDEICAPDEPAK